MNLSLKAGLKFSEEEVSSRGLEGSRLSECVVMILVLFGGGYGMMTYFKEL